MATKEAYLEEVEVQLPRFDADIARLRNRISSVHNVDMRDCGERVDELCAKYTILKLRFQALGHIQDERWERHRWRIERAINELRSSIDDVGAWVRVRSAE